MDVYLVSRKVNCLCSHSPHPLPHPSSYIPTYLPTSLHKPPKKPPKNEFFPDHPNGLFLISWGGEEVRRVSAEGKVGDGVCGGVGVLGWDFSISNPPKK